MDQHAALAEHADRQTISFVREVLNMLMVGARSDVRHSASGLCKEATQSVSVNIFFTTCEAFEKPLRHAHQNEDIAS